MLQKPEGGFLSRLHSQDAEPEKMQLQCPGDSKGIFSKFYKYNILAL